MLPKTFDEFPVFFIRDQKYRDLLDGCMFLEVVEQYVEKLREIYDGICEKIPEFSRHEFDKFMEVRMLLSSRLFGSKIDGQESGVMAPLADMLNHSPNHNIEFSF